MGLTAQSTGLNSMDTGITIAKNNPDERIIAIGGNPNVGKSTVFNALDVYKRQPLQRHCSPLY